MLSFSVPRGKGGRNVILGTAVCRVAMLDKMPAGVVLVFCVALGRVRRRREGKYVGKRSQSFLLVNFISVAR